MSIFKACVTRFDTSAYVKRIRPERPVYMGSGGYADVFSNETSSSYKYTSRVSSGAYLGIGSHQNFNHIFRTQPTSVVLVDVSPKVVDHLIAFRAALKLTGNPLQFLALIGSRMSLHDARKLSVESDKTLKRLINIHLFQTDRDLPTEATGDKQVAETNLALAKSQLLNSEEYQTLERIVLAQCDRTNFAYVPSRILLCRIFSETYYDRFLGERDELQDYQNDWLKSLEAFTTLHNLAVNGRISIIEGNIAESSVADSINQGLSSLSPSQKISVAYFSNVDLYIQFAGLYPDYVNTLKSLPWIQSPLVLRTHSYVIGHKADLHKYFNDANDPFYYQVLEGPSAKFFEDEPLPTTREELAKFFLFKEAEKSLMRLGVSSSRARAFVLSYGDAHTLKWNDLLYLDVPSLLEEYDLGRDFMHIIKKYD